MTDRKPKPTARDIRTMRAEATRKALEGDVAGALAMTAVTDLVAGDVDPDTDDDR